MGHSQITSEIINVHIILLITVVNFTNRISKIELKWVRCELTRAAITKSLMLLR